MCLYPSINSVQSLSCVQLFGNARLPSIISTLSLLKLMSIKSLMPSNHLILCHPLLLLPSIFSSIRVFSNESTLHIKWSKYQSFSFIFIGPSNEYSGLISFRTDWFDLLKVQGTLKSLLNTTVQKYQCFGAQLSLCWTIHDYWKKRSFDQMDLCWQSNISAFQYAVQVCHSFSSKEQVSFNFMAVTIRSDFGAQENKICHCTAN